VIRLGMIGYSEGNGHPFSFSAIVNGYDDAAFGDAGWPVIHAYLKAQPPENFGFSGARVTHAWGQDAALTAKLCAACGIDNACTSPGEMLSHVDAVVVARDDWGSHMEFARPFLEAGKAVFVDKPLTLDPAELAWFEPFLRQGRLMTTSGLRYARELDPLRNGTAIGTVKLASGTVLNGLEKYGIHMVEALAGLAPRFSAPLTATRLDAGHEAFAYGYPDGSLFQLNCLGGAVAKTFRLSVFGDEAQFHADLHDNFTAFRRTLAAFLRMIETGRPQIDPDESLRILRLIAASSGLRPGQTVELR
jgi:predicted dehydrogenase